MITSRVVLMCCVILAAAPGFAAPPLDPLPAPFYSFDRASPTVLEGLVQASDVLMLQFPHPVAIIPGENLGLSNPLDDLDGFAFFRFTPPGQPFLLLFSVDRFTLGTAPPDPMLLMLGLPFNASDQAARGQAAGDQFASLELYTRSGGTARGRASNNVLIRNNYDEGGTDFSAQPPTHAQDTTNDDQDNVDGTGQPGAALRGVFPVIYFTASADSPSLFVLPGGTQPSGAHLFFNPDPFGAPTNLYAPFQALGLQQADDIDALVVFDADPYGIFAGNDLVLFSLTPWSPSLQTIPGASPIGAAADVFSVRPQQPPMLFVSAGELGLGAPSDNIDALELVPCTDALACAQQYAIRANRGDLNCDNSVDFGDINAFVLALANPAAYEGLYPFCPAPNRDIDGNGTLDFGDINPFVRLLSSGGTSSN